MCGIAGLLGREDKPLVQSMCDRIAHRGPDGEGIWTDDGVTLGHRRLSIIDHEGGAQPMESHDGRYCVVYNGEIYNHKQLRSHLEAAGCQFQSDHSDTEVLLEGYRHWGAAVVEKLEGMFAFALWDTVERTLFVARDVFGIKPFFYAEVNGDWLFASEQKALFAHPELERKADFNRIKERSTIEFLTGQSTLFAGIHQLPPGTHATLRPGNAACHVAWTPYYQVPVESYTSIEDAAATIRERFIQSVDEQLMADVPLGVILSGGLDSAAVAAVHQTLLADAPIHTFTIAESEEVADFQAARQLSEHLGTEHHETFFDVDDVMADLPRYTWHNENINYTEFFFQPLFAFMRETVTVGLCGQGSDELWGGYSRYANPLEVGKHRIKRVREAKPAHEEELCTLINSTHMSGQSLAEWDQQGQLNNFQLRLVDRNSMAASLEVRVPFLSQPLHAASRAVPWSAKVQEMEKFVLRKALEDVGMPHDLVWRKKVPAGRATGPKVMDQFEAHAAKLAPIKHNGVFERPAEQLVYNLWEEIFIHRDGYQGLALEDLA
ncbi:MAG: asparagine synthase (glutamine-hydrolyzing) [Thermoplasmatota archaeon]